MSSAAPASYLVFTILFYSLLCYVGSRWSIIAAKKLPEWLDQEWRSQAEDYLEMKDAIEPPPYSWWSPFPRKRESTGLVIAIPLLGPLVKKNWGMVLNDILFIIVGVVLVTICSPLDAITGLLLFAILRCASIVDHKTQLLPDCLTLPLLWFGLAKAAMLGTPGMLVKSVLGAILGFMLLWSLQKGYYILKKVDGMGGGDLKIAAAIGAWVGIEAVPSALLVGSLIGIGYAAASAVKNKGLGRFAFGPSLAAGGMLVYLYTHAKSDYIHLLDSVMSLVF